MFRIPLALSLCLSLAAGAQAQDAGNGERVFAACKLCHQLGVDAKSAAGPELNGILGRRAGDARHRSGSRLWAGNRDTRREDSILGVPGDSEPQSNGTGARARASSGG